MFSCKFVILQLSDISVVFNVLLSGVQLCVDTLVSGVAQC